MKRIFTVFLALALLLAAAPAGADSGFYVIDRAAGVALTPVGNTLRVDLGALGASEQFVVCLTLGTKTEQPGLDNIIYLRQRTGDTPFDVTPSASWLSKMDGAALTLWISGGAEFTLSVGYGAAGADPDPEPEPTPTPTPTPSPAPSGGGSSSGGGGSSGGGASGGGTSPAPSPDPQPEPSETPGFSDTAGHWGEEYIAEAVSRGLLQGYGDGRFGPNDTMTRAQFITVLWRAAGRPAAAADAPFADVAGQLEEFRDAIAWGYAAGYINGVGADRFSPAGSLTREQAMKILFWYDGGNAGGAEALASVYDGGFSDSAALSDWGRLPMYWGVYNRIISGMGDGTLAPKSATTRAQLAKILIAYLDGAGADA